MTELEKVVWAPASTASGRYCERLEYGKYTNGHGIAEVMEHDVLADSPQFPNAARPFCGPRIIGTSMVDNDVVPGWAKHGTVIQPVQVSEHHITVIAARGTSCPEGHTNRAYQRARFMIADTEASPFSLYRTFQEHPLLEVVRDRTSNFPALPLAESEGVVESAGEFLQQTLPYILCGVSVAIYGEIEEAEFFRLAEAIWTALPERVRGGFSAGWGAGASMRGGLTFSAGLAADSSSLICEREGKGPWKFTEPTTPDGGWRDTFHLARLYYKFIYEDPDMTEERLRRIDAFLEPQLPLQNGVLRWEQPGVKKLFSAVSEATYDSWRCEQFRGAFRAGDAAQLEQGSLREALYSNRAFQVCVDFLLDALLDSRENRLALSVLGRWIEEEGSPVASMIERAPGEAGESGRHFLHLLRDPEALLRMVRNSAEVERSWSAEEEEALCITLGRRNPSPRWDLLEIHRQLLKKDPLPNFYRTVLGRSAWQLALELDAAGGPERESELRSLQSLPFPPAGIDALCSLATWQPPVDRVDLEGCDPHVLTEFEARIAARYKDLEKLPGAQQDTWLRWAVRFLLSTDITLVRIVRDWNGYKSTPLNGTQVQDICADVEAGRVPPMAEAAVADTAREYIPTFLPLILEKRTQWARIAQHWPAPLATLFGFGKEPITEDPLGGQLLTPVALEKLLTIWAGELFPKLGSVGGMARQLMGYAWNVSTTDAAAPAAWLCHDLQKKNSYTFSSTGSANPSVTVKTVEIAAKLINALRPAERQRLLINTPDDLRQRANNGEKLLLLLLLYPDHSFALTDVQREYLSRIRSDARRLLPPFVWDNKSRLRVSLAEFGELPFHQWEDFLPEKRDSVLWAPIRSVPINKQGDLLKALQHYSEGNARKRIECCQLYIDQASTSADRTEAARRVKALVVDQVVRSMKGYASVYADRYFALALKFEDPREVPSDLAVIDGLDTLIELGSSEGQGGRIDIFKVDRNFLKLSSDVYRLVPS